MSVRMALLTLVADGPRYGYQLRGEFEERTGGTWALNVGQVYTTLSRLTRDGLVAVDATTGGEDTRTYVATPAGRAAVAGWFATPVARGEVAPREELAMKLALALATPGVDIRAVVQRQRVETLTALQQLTRAKLAIPVDAVARLLLLESQLFAVEAEARWLDLVESVLLARVRTAAAPPAPSPPAQPAPPPVPPPARRRPALARRRIS
jgi:DNA-binding PadR family transcriptional regulator